MHYSIRHVTRFRYSAPVRESVMELRMQPRSEGPQALRSFQIATNPRAQLYAYTDHLGNAVYHFNVLREHQELRIETQAVIEMAALHALPEAADPLEWQRYNDYNLSVRSFRSAGAVEIRAHLRRARANLRGQHDLAAPQGDPLHRAEETERGDPRRLRIRSRHHRSPFAHRSCAEGNAAASVRISRIS